MGKTIKLREPAWKSLRDTIVKENIEERIIDRRVQPKTKNHEKYFNAIKTSVVTLVSGPAGTGKTYIACGIAAEMLKDGKIDKIILARPIVECGNRKIGALPGELKDKVAPYMKPVMEAFEKFFGPVELKKRIDAGQIIIEPLEFMRGMTYDRTFMILDEAQNVDESQMLMWLTRIGEGTIQVICGDIDQIDLPNSVSSGLVRALKQLKDPSIAKVKLTEDDIMRAGIVRVILKQWYVK